MAVKSTPNVVTASPSGSGNTQYPRWVSGWLSRRCEYTSTANTYAGGVAEAAPHAEYAAARGQVDDRREGSEPRQDAGRI